MCSGQYSPNEEPRNLKKFRIEYNSQIGRHLVASQDIEPGEIIIDEPPIVRGPCVDTSNKNVKPDWDQWTRLACCVCFKGLDLGKRQCNMCGCNLFCSQECSQSTTHTEDECRILRAVKNISQSLSVLMYCNIITTVRCLLVRRKNRFQWLQICKLQSKIEELASANAFADIDRVFEKLEWNSFGFSPNELAEDDFNDLPFASAARHCYGVMRMNAYSYLNQFVGFEGLYFFTSLLSHRCIMNTDRQFDLTRGGQMVVKAAMKIKEGEIITTSYVSLMNNTEQRHQDMRTNWFFTCQCRRCEDPTELGTFMSSTSTSCGNTDSELGKEDASGDESNCLIKSSLPNNFTDVDSLEGWLTKFDTGKYLHTNHSLFSQVKLFLCLYYGRKLGGITKLSNEKLLRKYQLCCEIMEIFKVLYPGIYQCKGELLFELWTTVRELNTRGINYHVPPGGLTESALAFSAHEILCASVAFSSFHHMKEILEDEYPELRDTQAMFSTSPAKKLKLQ